MDRVASRSLWVHCVKHNVNWTWPLAVSPEFVLLRYPDSWYRDITSNKKFFSLAATYRGTIVGMIVAEIKSRTKIHKEVSVCTEDGPEPRGRIVLPALGTFLSGAQTHTPLISFSVYVMQSCAH